MTDKPLVPRNWTTTRAIQDAKKRFIPVTAMRRGKPIPAFNGSLTSKRNKRRPITLPGGPPK